MNFHEMATRLDAVRKGARKASTFPHHPMLIICNRFLNNCAPQVWIQPTPGRLFDRTNEVAFGFPEAFRHWLSEPRDVLVQQRCR